MKKQKKPRKTKKPRTKTKAKGKNLRKTKKPVSSSSSKVKVYDPFYDKSKSDLVEMAKKFRISASGSKNEIKARLVEVMAETGEDESMPGWVYKKMDQMDDEALAERMLGNSSIAQKLLYSFKQGGQRVIGFSDAGVNEAWNERTRDFGLCAKVVRAGDKQVITVIDEDDYIMVIVLVGEYRLGVNSKTGEPISLEMNTALGAKRQWKKMQKKDGSICPDLFFFEKAITKATRNAKLKLLPLTFQEKMKERFLQVGSVTAVTSTGYITNEQRKYLIGLCDNNLDKLKAFLKTMNITSSTKIPANIYEDIKQKLLQMKRQLAPPPEIPKAIHEEFDEYEILADETIAEAKRRITWEKFYNENQGDTKKAAKALVAYIKSREREATNKKRIGG